MKRKSRNAESKASGFTLVEMLVTVAVVGVVLAISVPVLHQVRERVADSRSISNLRQIGVGMRLFLTENHDYFPKAWTWDLDERGQHSWIQRLQSYVGEEANSDRSVWVTPRPQIPIVESQGGWVSTYAMSRRIGDPLGPMHLGEILRPSEVILVADSTQQGNTYAAATLENPWQFGWPDPWSDLDAPIPVPPPGEAGWINGISYHHNGRAHCLMVDGSVRGFARGEILNRHAIPDR